VLFLAASQPGLLRRRCSPAKESPDWDVRILKYLRASLLLTLAVAGFEGRWPSYQADQFAFGAALLLVGTLTLCASFHSNPFFETQVRHQNEQGQTVVQTGLYGWIRHPGYLAMILMLASLPVMLHSTAALVPCGLCIGILVARLRAEELHLRTHLDGYAEYTGRVRFRLIPRLW
jgi:protein-S-isoprenylcysteine O-methyltransferase Ste14